MSIFSLSDGSDASTTGNSYEAPQGNEFAPIPDGSTVLAMINAAKWEAARTDTSKHFVQLEWTVLEPQEYKNRKIWQKLWINDYDPNAKDDAAAKKKRDNARRMLSAIDVNCGGKLAKLVERNPNGVPDDDDMAISLTNRPMVIKIKVWEIKDGLEVKQGNWIVAVAPKSAQIAVPKVEHVTAASPNDLPPPF